MKLKGDVDLVFRWVLVGLCLELFLLLLEEGVKSVPDCADDGSLSQIRQMKRISW